MIGSAFLGVSWMVIFAVIIISTLWIVKSDKKKRNKALTDARRKWEQGDITEAEYKKRVKEIWGG